MIIILLTDTLLTHSPKEQGSGGATESHSNRLLNPPSSAFEGEFNQLGVALKEPVEPKPIIFGFKRGN